MSQLKPFTEQVRAHYDLSNDFYRLFLDPTMTYSSGVWDREDMTLEESQRAKYDQAYDRLGLEAGDRVLDVGFGWGAAMRHAAETRGCNVVGLSISQAQFDHVSADLQQRPVSNGSVEILLKGWEEFEQKVDHIYSFEVMEHFRHERYQAFFDRCKEILPVGGRCLIQVNSWTDDDEAAANNLEVTHEHVMFAKFIRAEIFPHAMLPHPKQVIRHAEQAGFKTLEHISLRPHYVKTLDCWAANLEAAKDRALELVGQERYDAYMKYLTGCSKNFSTGHIDVPQFTFEAT